MLFSLYILPQCFSTFSYLFHKILKRSNGFLDTLTFGFFRAIFHLVIWVSLATPSTCRMSSAALHVASIPLAFKAPQGCRGVQFYPFEAISNFYLHGYRQFVKFHDVSLCLYLFSLPFHSYPQQLNATSWLIGSDLFDRPSITLRTKVESCKSLDHSVAGWMIA